MGLRVRAKGVVRVASGLLLLNILRTRTSSRPGPSEPRHDARATAPVGVVSELQAEYNTAFLTDAQLEDYTSMDETAIRTFLDQHKSHLKGPLADSDDQMIDPPSVMAQAASDHRINPKVIPATIEKEQVGVTRESLEDWQLSSQMGCGAPSTTRQQIACGAATFGSQFNRQENGGYTTNGWRVGVPKQTQDGVMMTPATMATAGQFSYTPYVGRQWGGNHPR